MYSRDLATLAEAYTCLVVLVFWFLTDIMVVVSNTSGWEIALYLTNQVWAFGVITRVVVFGEVCKLTHPELTLDDYSWLASMMFLLLGILQIGVFFTFSILLLFDGTIIDHAVNDNRAAVVVVWNDVRHILPVVMHLVLLLFMRAYFATNILRCAPWWWGERLDRTKMALLLWAVPMFLGLFHAAFTDDEELYMFTDAAVGARCQLGFAMAACLGSILVAYVYIDKAVEGDLRSTSIQTNPTRRDVTYKCRPEQTSVVKAALMDEDL